MNFEIVRNYRINLNEDNYVIFNCIKFENDDTKIYPDVRSVEIYINDQIYTYFNDNEIKSVIYNYLHSQDNVGLINLISKRINDKNWFECYSNESIVGSNDAQIKPELLDEKSNIKITELYKLKLY